MVHGLAWVCAVSGLLVGMAEGQPPALDKTTLAAVRKLQEKRRDVLREALAARETLYGKDRATLEGAVKTSEQLLAAELDLAKTDGERIAAHQSHIDKARAWFQLAKARHQAARATAAETLDAQAVLLAAEIGLLKAGGKLKKVEK